MFSVDLLLHPSTKSFKRKNIVLRLYEHYEMKQLITFVCCLFSFILFSQNERIDDLTLKLAYQDTDSKKIDISLLLIDELYETEDYRKALLYINQSAKLAEKINYEKGLAEVIFYKALIYTKRNDYHNAIDNYRKSRAYYSQINDTLGVAKVSSGIGLAEIKRGNYTVGLKNSLSAIHIFEKQGLADELGYAYSNLAEAYLMTNQIDKAIEFNLKALEIRERINDLTNIIETTEAIAELYSIRKEHRKSIEYFEKTLQMLNPVTDQNIKIRILPKLGNEYLKFKEYDKANTYLILGLKQNREQNNEEGILLSLNAIANLNLQRENLELAESQINEAYNIAQKIDNEKALLENYKLQISFDSILGNFQDAFIWQKRYYALKERLSEENKPIVMADIEPSTIENTDLYGENDDTEMGVSRKSWFNNPFVLFSSFAASAILLTLLLFNYLKTKTYQKVLLDKRKRLAKVLTQNKHVTEQNQHLEDANQVKDKLFSIVSHDLKDSISSIKTFLDLLKEESVSKEEFNELIPKLSENADNASSLIFNLLNWSKSQMQNLDPKPEFFNIQDVFYNKIALVDQKIKDKGISLVDKSQHDLIYADKSMVEIVIQNLITNAVKFCRKDDTITISNKDINGRALICIKDTGVGISKKNINKLFSANKNFTTIGTKNEKGTGLGLTIAKDLIELNNGEIWVESTIDVGSKFFIELPKKAS